MDGCDQESDDSCVVVKGETATGKLYFKTSKAVESLECKIYGNIGVWIPFPGGCPKPNACDVSIDLR
jgi:hypothetical protein